VFQQLIMGSKHKRPVVRARCVEYMALYLNAIPDSAAVPVAPAGVDATATSFADANPPATVTAMTTLPGDVIEDLTTSLVRLVRAPGVHCMRR
jgi:hypothetical protein